MMIQLLPLLAVLGIQLPWEHKTPPVPQIGESARYACADGRSLEVLYGGGVAVVTIGGATIQLNRAAGADGERYVGGGWQWSAKGKRIGALNRLEAGQDSAPAGVSCRAS